MESFLQDLKHSIRMFLNSPGFTLTAVLALALGVGANTAIFSVINTVLLRPMPYPDPDRFVFFTTVYPNGTGTGGSPATFNFWKAQTETVEYAAAWRFGVANYNSGGNPEQVQVTQASADFFPLCGATALYGRTFSKEEDLPRGPKVAVLVLWILATALRFGSERDWQDSRTERSALRNHRHHRSRPED